MISGDEHPPVLVTGSMRSGTTFVGNVLAASSDFFYLHEPLNPVWGIASNDRWFLYVRDADDRGGNVIDGLMRLEVKFRTPETGRPIRDLIKRWIGSRSGWRAAYYKHIASRRARLLLKDPLAALASRYMHDHYGVDVLVLVRHPMAFYYSNKRLGWDFDLDHFLSQDHLLADHLVEEVPLLERKDLSYAQRIGLLWRCVYRALTNFSRELEREQNWVVKRHEDICTQPKKEFSEVFERIGVPFGGDVKQFIDEHMDTSNTVQAEGKTHKLQRNSRNLVDYWKEHVSKNEITAVRTITGEIASLYYDESTWAVGDPN
jgi:hypothetical protein